MTSPRPLDPDCPQLYGTGEIRMESAERASGYWTTRADKNPEEDVRTSGVYWRADPEDVSILDGRDDRKRAELIAEGLRHWSRSRTSEISAGKVSDSLPGAHDRTRMSTELDPLVLVDRFSKRRPAPSVRGRRVG